MKCVCKWYKRLYSIQIVCFSIFYTTDTFWYVYVMTQQSVWGVKASSLSWSYFLITKVNLWWNIYTWNFFSAFLYNVCMKWRSSISVSLSGLPSCDRLFMVRKITTNKYTSIQGKEGRSINQKKKGKKTNWNV